MVISKTSIYVVISTILFIIASIIVVWQRVVINKTLDRISEMIDNALYRNFSHIEYDESKMSSIEDKMNRYLIKCINDEKAINDEKDKIKSLISDISHQTKTPIANIMLYSSLLRETESIDKDSMTMIEEICSQSEKLNFLVSTLIKTSRLESGLINVKPCRNYVKELIDSVAAQLKVKCDTKHIDMSILLEDNQEQAIFDMKWTKEVLHNILDNAVKYSSSGSKIIIKVVPYEMFCSIEVTDNGIGISEEDISRIFQRFYRAQKVQQEEGAGIGLYLARKILSEEGGYIKVSSKEGEGSKFTIFLPKES